MAKLRAGIAERVPDILDRLTEAALAGDVQAARLLLERVLPPVKPVELPVELTLAEGRPRPSKRVRCSLRRLEEPLRPTRRHR